MFESGVSSAAASECMSPCSSLNWIFKQQVLASESI